jgi:hypothetical protein
MNLEEHREQQINGETVQSDVQAQRRDNIDSRSEFRVYHTALTSLSTRPARHINIGSCQLGLWQAN